AANLRAGTKVGDPVGRPSVAMECTDVGTNGLPDEMRSVIARMYDLTIWKGHLPYAFGGGWSSGSIFARSSTGSWVCHGNSAGTFLQENQRSLCVLARRAGITLGAYQMTGLFHVHTYIGVDRGTQSAKDLIDDTVAWMYTNL